MCIICIGNDCTDLWWTVYSYDEEGLDFGNYVPETKDGYVEIMNYDSNTHISSSLENEDLFRSGWKRDGVVTIYV